MEDFYSPADHYTYPNSSVLRNRLGLQGQEELNIAEKLLVHARLIDTSSVPRTFDYTHFRALHFHMFQDLYDWAGMERDVTIFKGKSRFASPLHIGKQGCRVLSELRDNLRANRHSFGTLPNILSHFVIEMNVVHPFREGNGRHLRAFLQQVLEEMGCGVRADVLRREVWIDSVIAGFHGDEGPMAALLAEAIVTPATNREVMFDPFPESMRHRLCAMLKRGGFPADITREYKKTLRC